ncbi:MAG: hypothetical protein HFJ33_00640 [Clostridia bacterium]|nr:hypothetical protein [Clostridia bacterium]
MRKVIQNKGITLIALVMTIIILLILAGMSIATLTGENGILSKASFAEEETKKKEYEEILKLIANELRANKIMNNWDNKTFLDEFEKEIPKEEKLKEAEMNRKNDETIIVITKEGYIYEVTENKVEYIGKQGGVEIPKLEESNIVFRYNPSPEEQTWTNGKVDVSIVAQTSEYQLQYSLDAKNWKNYEKEVEVQQNGVIYARLVNNLYESVCQATGNVTNIDATGPTATISFNSTNTNTVSSIIATVEQMDNQSGINITNCKWVYNTISGSIGTNEEDYTGGNFTITPEEIELKVETAGIYYLHVLAIDNAGNKKEIISKQEITVKETDRIPPNDAEITLTSTRVDVGSTVTATITVSDEQSGINLEKCKYIINNSLTKLGSDSTTWDTATTLSGITSNIPITSNTRGSLYLHILSVDNENNKTETVSEGIYFAETVPIFSLAYKSGISCGSYVAWPEGWSHQEAGKYYQILDSRGGLSYMQSNQMFDITNFNLLMLNCIGWNDTGCGGWISLCVCDSNGNIAKRVTQNFDWYTTKSDTNISLNLDVSSLSGNYYIRIELQKTSGRYTNAMKAPVTLIAK